MNPDSSRWQQRWASRDEPVAAWWPGPLRRSISTKRPTQMWGFGNEVTAVPFEDTQRGTIGLMPDARGVLAGCLAVR